MKNTKEIISIITEKAQKHERIVLISREILALIKTTQKDIYSDSFYDVNLHSKVLELSVFFCQRYKIDVAEKSHNSISKVPIFHLNEEI